MSLEGAALIAAGGIIAGAFIATVMKELEIPQKAEEMLKKVFEKPEQPAEPVCEFDTKNGRIVYKEDGETQWDMAKPVVCDTDMASNQCMVTVRWNEASLFTRENYSILKKRTDHLLDYLKTVQVDDAHTLADYVDASEVHYTTVHYTTSGDTGETLWTTDLYFAKPCAMFSSETDDSRELAKVVSMFEELMRV